ncbi:SMP-30/gluconolactonase/LRE family protein [Streptomyces huiliensis]|uniref:SMP-30/gluconolactonase/LRE family protein n=1 Tax=Streptomyces huiliensis TaxID=2876027 RepID=UPI001CBE3191|nr:superoxide dismutase [Streptomyces huiliensis]MBZ4320233.1 superoxide dismutase [Streptomyces huiliensis]
MARSFTRRTLLATGAAAAALAGSPALAAPLPEPSWPTRFPLPDGFRPEGIAIGPGPYAWFGSLGSGALYRAHLPTGRGAVVPTRMETASIGLKTDRRGRAFVAGGATRQLRVVDTRDGSLLAVHEVGRPATFVNDVVLAGRTAWFTDSTQPFVYGLPLGPRGELPAPRDVISLRLTGEWAEAPAEGFTSNGIAATPDGRALLVVNVFQDGGSLLRVDPRTGDARRVDLGGRKLPDGDGLLVLGRTLHVVQQVQNAIDVFHLDPAGLRGTWLTRVTDPRFRVPTTVAAYGDRLYLPNSRLTEPPTPTTDYDAVAVHRVR